MTQGYGQQNNPMDPYGQQPGGQGDQQQGWGQQPAGEQQGWGQPGGSSAAPADQQQWGQAPGASPAPAYGSPAPAPDGYGSPAPAPGGYGSPASAPAGYPGTAGAAPSAPATAPSTLDKLTKWLLILAIAVVAVRLAQYIVGAVAGFAIGASSAGGGDAMGVTALGGGIVALLMLLLNGVVSLALLVVAIIVAVQARGRGRIGALIVVGAIVLAVVLYWIVQVIYMIAVGASTDPESVGVWALVVLVLEIGRGLLIAVALIVGAMMARRWVKQSSAGALSA